VKSQLRQEIERKQREERIEAHDHLKDGEEVLENGEDGDILRRSKHPERLEEVKSQFFEQRRKGGRREPHLLNAFANSFSAVFIESKANPKPARPITSRVALIEFGLKRSAPGPREQKATMKRGNVMCSPSDPEHHIDLTLSRLLHGIGILRSSLQDLVLELESFVEEERNEGTHRRG